MHAFSDDAFSLQMAQYGSGPQRGPMGQTLMGGLNNVGQRGIPGNAGLGQAALQRQAGNGVNMGALGGASGKCLCMGSQATLYALLHPDVFGVILQAGNSHAQAWSALLRSQHHVASVAVFTASPAMLQLS